MYIFMQTSLETRANRNSNGPENTLRALPGQTFEDGTPIDPTLNIQSPKDNALYDGGTRLEYPIGTVFACDHLELVDTKRTKFYSVYDLSKSQTGQNPGDLRFHPVSADPSFVFLSPKHKDVEMNNAYISWKPDMVTFKKTVSRKKTAKTARPSVCLAFITPCDPDGNARGPIKGWQEAYQGQIETEGEILKNWFKRQLKTLGIRPAITPAMNAVSTDRLTKLYERGETINSLLSALRLECIIAKEKVDAVGISILSQGPFQWYLDVILDEHEKGENCTAMHRLPDEQAHVSEAVYAICASHNAKTGNITSPDLAVASDAVKKALEAGWSLNEMILPEYLEKNDDLDEYLEDLASGKIPLPERPVNNGASFIENVMANKNNACPKDEDGFHVDPTDWKKLVRNLYQKTNTLLAGPTGTGKTQLIQKLCEQTGTPCTVIQMGTITDPTEQLVGKMDIVSTGGTVFDYADFALAIQKPGVVILDEINRCPRNGTNILFSCLDGTRCITASGAKSSDMRVIPVHPECVFFATANVGYEYSGTAQIDKALQTRFMMIKTKYMTVDQEKQILMVRSGISEGDAYNIAFIANQIRRKKWEGELASSVSTRETLLCADYVRDGFTCREAIEACFYPLFDEGNSMWGTVDVNSELHKVEVIVDGLLQKTTA